MRCLQLTITVFLLLVLMTGPTATLAQTHLAESDQPLVERNTIGLPPSGDDEGPDVPDLVTVTNFPETQFVTGAVEVTNLPAVQPVAGSVAVSNFPSMYPVSGAVTVTNLPDTQNVNGMVDVGNFPAVQQVGGSLEISNLPAVQTVGGTVSVGNLPAIQPVTGAVEVTNLGDVQLGGSVEVSNFPPEQQVAGTVEIGNLPTTQEVTGSVTIANLPPVQQVEVTNLPGQPQPFGFVGVTSQHFQGNGTRAAMNAVCHAEYPGSRMAFSDEYAYTVDAPPVVESAWVQVRPTIYVSTQIVIDAAGNWYVNNAGGSSNPSWRFTCASWTTSGSDARGGVLEPSGALTLRLCNEALAVACSAPQ